MENAKCLNWEYFDYSAHIEKSSLYCRMANKVMKFNPDNCFNCPLWNGDCREVHCAYYGPVVDNDVDPKSMKKLMDGVIAIGYDSEFPIFVTEDRINFAGRNTPEAWTKKDFQRLEQAYQFAANAHKGQVRKKTTIPYIMHPVEASIITFEMTDDVSVIIAAILHDVVEDTEYQIEDIDRIFGNEIAELVNYESENKRENIPATDSWKIRKQEFLDHLSMTPIEAKMITLADKLSNMRAIARDYDKCGDEIWNRFNQKNKKEHEWYYRSIAELTSELNEFKSYEEYLSLCDAVFTK